MKILSVEDTEKWLATKSHPHGAIYKRYTFVDEIVALQDGRAVFIETPDIPANKRMTHAGRVRALRRRLKQLGIEHTTRSTTMDGVGGVVVIPLRLVGEHTYIPEKLR